MAKSNETIRTLDAGKSWPSKGQTADRGIGSRCRTMLAELCLSDAQAKQVRAAYGKVSTVVKGLSEDLQRVTLLCAASDFTLDSLIVKSRQARWTAGPRLGARDEARIEAIRKSKGDEAADSFREMLLWSKAETKGSNGSE